ncbi:MAG: hypothetical protein M3442_11760 [Chloroflexota bacterium]|nr:hypothetical protein [Chloroflexota bacterium]
MERCNEAAQLVVGAAVLDTRYCALLVEQRARALEEVVLMPSAPAHVRLTTPDREELMAIRARTLREFSLGVVRLMRLQASRPRAERRSNQKSGQRTTPYAASPKRCRTSPARTTAGH